MANDNQTEQLYIDLQTLDKSDKLVNDREYTWKTIPKYPNFADIETEYCAQNVSNMWINIYLFCEMYLMEFLQTSIQKTSAKPAKKKENPEGKKMRKIVSFHPEDNKCSAISGMNHWIKYKTLGATSYNWTWYATLSLNHFYYVSTGNFNPFYDTVDTNNQEINNIDSNAINSTHTKKNNRYIPRPITQNWIKTVDGTGIMNICNIRGIINRFHLDEIDINLFMAMSYHNTIDNIIGAINILEIGGWAVIALPNIITADIMRAIILFSEHFNNTLLANIANSPFLIGKSYKTKKNKRTIDNIDQDININLLSAFAQIDKVHEYEIKCCKIDKRLLL